MNQGALCSTFQRSFSVGVHVAFLDMDTGLDRQRRREALEKASRVLEISLTDMLLQTSTPSEYQRVFGEIAQARPHGIIVSGISEVYAYRRLIVGLVEKSRLPAMYPSPARIGWRRAR